MKVVLLAAGRSVRMQPVADKNFLQFLGKPLIEHQMGALVKASFSDILIMAGSHNLAGLRKLAESFCKTHRGVKIAVKEQENLNLGMAGALISAEPWIKNDPFLVVSSNDVVAPQAFDLIHNNIKKDEGILLAKELPDYFPGGYLKLHSNGVIKTIVEKPVKGKQPSKLVNIVIHYHSFPKALISNLKKISSNRDDRYECALQVMFDSLGQTSQKTVYRAAKFTGFWQPVKYPWHVLALMNNFLSGIKLNKKGAQVAKTAVLKGSIYLGEGACVLDNAVIQGPAYIGAGSVVATNALVRQSHVGANCVIGFGSEVARSYIGDNVWTHTNYIGDSVIGNNVSFGAGTVAGNLRLDEKTIAVNINGGKIDSGADKLGLIAGDNIRVGVNVSFMPGVKIGSNSFIGAGIVIGQDIPSGSYVKGDWELKIRENRERIGLRTSYVIASEAKQSRHVS